MSTRNTLLVFGALVLAACGGGGSTSASDVAPLGSAEAAVREFLAAVQDSNIARMGRAWGSSSGPAAVTNTPAQWEQRLKVVQVYLRGGNYRITGNVPDASSARRRNLSVEFTRGDCVKQVPFVAVETSRGGWLVESVDISVAGNPLNPCPATGSDTPANP
ncbi:MAG: hypothetical protein ABJB33_00870 [Gemmatimonadota bacterium]